MNERSRATTLRLRTPTQVQVPGAAGPTGAPPRVPGGPPARPAGFEPRRPPQHQVHTFAPRRDPTSEAILAELAALGLAEAEDTDPR